MKTVTLKTYGTADVLELQNLPRPKPGPNQVLVKVTASSVNPVDWKVRTGDVKIFSGLKKPPRILGADFAGEIAEVGDGISAYKPGDKVFGMLRAFKGGAYAQYLIAEPENLAHAPNGLSNVEAGSLPLVGLTIWQLFEQAVALSAGQKILINGCTGGIGHIAVQWAKALGLHVTGVCSTKNIDFAKSLGVDQIIDYRQQSLSDLSDRKFDLVFDAADTLSFAQARKNLTPNGTFVSPIPSLKNMIWSPMANRFRRHQEKFLWVAPSHKGLRRIADLANEQSLKPHIGLVLPLEDMAEAHRQSEAGKVAGKIGITIAH